MNSVFSPEHWRSIQIQFEGQRLRRGWSRKELASKARVSRTTLFNLERGSTHQPRVSTLKRLAETLDLDFHRLIDETLSSSPAVHTDHGDSMDRGDFRSPDDSSRFDRETNPCVAQVFAEAPGLFQGFTAADWDELYSCMGMGGALTTNGVRDQVARIGRKKQLIRKLDILLETHYSEVAAALLETLFRQVQIVPSGGGSETGWQAPLRESPPGQK